MLARAGAVSEEKDKHFINLVYKLALSRRSLLFTLIELYMYRTNVACCNRLVTGTSIQDSRSIYKAKNVIRIMTTFSKKKKKKNDIFL